MKTKLLKKISNKSRKLTRVRIVFQYRVICYEHLKIIQLKVLGLFWITLHVYRIDIIN